MWLSARQHCKHNRGEIRTVRRVGNKEAGADLGHVNAAKSRENSVASTAAF
jgi:hypothetical protein